MSEKQLMIEIATLEVKDPFLLQVKAKFPHKAVKLLQMYSSQNEATVFAQASDRIQ